MMEKPVLVEQWVCLRLMFLDRTQCHAALRSAVTCHGITWPRFWTDCKVSSSWLMLPLKGLRAGRSFPSFPLSVDDSAEP